MDLLPHDHFLAQPRPDAQQTSAELAGVVDTTTLAAHDFDVDNRTGFMPPQPPPARLPVDWEPWELILDEAIHRRLQLAQKPNITQEEMDSSAAWRANASALPVLPTDSLHTSEVNLRRAHHVLTFIMHFYIHSIPLDQPVVIPRGVGIPLLQVSKQLNLPPVLTYSDNVLYNWDLITPSAEPTPGLFNLRSQTLFTGTNDEQEFYLASSRIEVRGVEALELMRETMDEAFVSDDIAIQRISGYLERLSVVIDELKGLLMHVKEGCNPIVFYDEIRPWFRGLDSDPAKRPWVFEGIEEAGIPYPTELSGPSAAQSSLIHVLDIFLGVVQYSHSSTITGHSADVPAKRAFLERMRAYMPRHHRNFLAHLAANPRPLRELVISRGDAKLEAAYNKAVGALKSFRDSHITIVALYIIGPSRRTANPEDGPLKGTGGTHLAKFLKEVRDGTQGAVLK
ncbi:Indoleamine 2,3-dioxygenase [Cylindrobasidium torrendii FP15055 ss-10]|uniref:Indoleamine 2,3-dioxygenase n=1 Tax=Cylindrobasidium torrendii FP15055 ss-10 TaxID=1314674 RepID=A0A0D7B5X8_9AGAR|nr:Indoleamine 2,3-dioxygenase [Cylindrobasidium torrendii FP15055 ss-10]